MVVSLHIEDTPVGYAPPRGPAINFTVTYNQREDHQPDTFQYSNLGNKWTFNWLAYIADVRSDTNVAKSYYVAGGGTAEYKVHDLTNNRWSTVDEDRSFLVQTSLDSYERQLPDGSRQIFNLPDGGPGARKVFMTQFIDPSGNSVSNSFDAHFRLVAVQDAIGLVTTISYASTNSNDVVAFYQIASVTDPYLRSATFDYNTNHQLVKITDPIGITSEFSYGSGDFITSMTTPYGTSTFAAGETEFGTTNRIRWLEATDPMGQKERLAYIDDLGAGTLPPEPTPAPYTVCASLTQYRNSFYWDKRAIQFTNDYTKAKIFHFLHDHSTDTVASGILGSEKAPLENRVYYSYPGQANCYHAGTSGQASGVARVLDDGTTQFRQFGYNELG